MAISSHQHLEVLPHFEEIMREQDHQELGLRKNAYKPGKFHPVYIGELYNERYLVLRKLGYGMYSTVWLVHDVHKKRYFAMKVLSAECYGSGHDSFESEILHQLRQEASEHLGSQYTSQLVEDFEVTGPNGWHVCLVFEVMAETLVNFGRFFEGDGIPSKFMKRFVKQLLLALDYAHGLGVIHTGWFPLFLKR
jgi:serine/threonine-protein kinase SRPK3